MGWSCSAKVSDVIRAWTDVCVAQTSSQNEYEVGGVRFFWELSRKEYDDGAATGTIVQVIESRPDGSSLARRVGSFRINGDGTVARAPGFLKKVSVTFRPPLGIGSGGW